MSDPMAVLRALRRDDLATNATAITRFHGGADAVLWRVDGPDGGAAYALRLSRPEQAAIAAREAWAMETARAAGLPVPEVFARGMWEDRPACLMAWCPGETALAACLGGPAARAEQIAAAMGRLQASLHAVPAPPQAFADGWINLVGADESALRARLRALPKPPPSLIHLDFHPLNVLVDAANGVTGLIDWTDARAGDPRADFARTIVLFRLTPVPPDALPPGAKRLRRRLERAWRQAYVAARPFSEAERAALPLFLAWAGAMTLDNLAPRVADPDEWLQDDHLRPLRRWTRWWKRRAGLSLAL